MKTEVAFRIIDFLHEHGTKVIVFTGGEPALVKDLPQILQHAKALNFQTILSTNGLLFGQRVDNIAPSLDWIALPIDATDPAINRKMRIGHADQMGAVLRLIPQLRSKYPNLKIKLGTVVSKINMEYVADVPLLLPPSDYPDMWKIYQASPTNYGKLNNALLEIDDAAFAEIEAQARETASKANIGFSVSRNAERNGKYLLIYPDGGVRVLNGLDEMEIGNVIDDPKAILTNWKRFVNEERLQTNIHATYPTPQRSILRSNLKLG
jgi:MoaA/NifB/PqqE/SkfB family radical SAM enzyme